MKNLNALLDWAWKFAIIIILVILVVNLVGDSCNGMAALNLAKCLVN